MSFSHFFFFFFFFHFSSFLFLFSQSNAICEIDPAILEKMKKFRFRKEQTNAAFTS